MWMGDSHANYKHGERIYRTLKTYLDDQFPRARLIRKYFDDARKDFFEDGIDLLHIDGLHTYEAVKHDFDTWIGAMTPSGVILFHDIAVRERDFGVHQLWAEIKERYATIEFGHSQGLGVVLLDTDAPQVAHLAMLAHDPNLQAFYRSLVNDIAEGMPQRMRVASMGGAMTPEITQRGKLVDVAIRPKTQKPSVIRKILRKTRGN
jgi:hypothetical protein